MAAPVINIGGRLIGRGHSTYLIAELSANHRGSLDKAIELVRLAAHAGADAVKIQTYSPETMTLDSNRKEFRIGAGTPWEGRRLFELYTEAATPWEWTGRLQEVAREAGIGFFSSPFDATAVAYLDAFDLPVFKIASFEIVDLELIREVASRGKPMIMSTGMASVPEIDEAVRTARQAGASEIALMRCNSAYPASPAEMDLQTIPHMAAGWKVPVGLSDHTLGTAASVAAVTLGACLIEKHFTDSRRAPGPDSSFSMEPSEFADLVAAVRTAEAAGGTVRYGPSEGERSSMVFRRSLFIVEDVEAGELLTERSVRVLRPGYGLPPRDRPRVVGRRAARPIEAGTPVSWDLLAT